MPQAETPQVVFSHDRRLMSLGRPDRTLYANTAEQVAWLPQRLTDALAQEYRFACGLLPYELGAICHGVASSQAADTNALTPTAVAHLYRHPPQVWRAGSGRSFRLTAPFRAEQSKARYLHAVDRILEWLSAGDCYQVNYAQRFQANWQGDPLAAFEQLVAQHPAPHACFFRHGDDVVFGVSPERFIRVTGRRILAEPIKGSRPRGRDSQEDQALGRELLASAKDRAENLMIVDLLRNDLGRLCVPGSIHADPLFALHRFSNVQHLISSVHGTLRPEVTPLGALLDAFPGGSITGAPKRRAMEIIAELEPVSRGAYCGSVFWQDDQGRFDSNILIRTLQTHGTRLYCHGGGGIVHDSDPEAEYRESRFKVQKLMAALETAAR